eukprot:510446_1
MTAPNVLKEDSTFIVHDIETQTEDEMDDEDEDEDTDEEDESDTHDVTINTTDDVNIMNQTKQIHSPTNQTKTSDVFPNDTIINISTEVENSQNSFAFPLKRNQTTADKVLDTITSNTAATTNTYDTNHMIQPSLDKHESSGTDHHHNEQKQLLIHARSSDNIHNYHEVGKLD